MATNPWDLMTVLAGDLAQPPPPTGIDQELQRAVWAAPKNKDIYSQGLAPSSAVWKQVNPATNYANGLVPMTGLQRGGAVPQLIAPKAGNSVQKFAALQGLVPTTVRRDYSEYMNTPPRTGGGMEQLASALGSMMGGGGMGGMGGGGMGGAPAEEKPPERKKTFDELNPNGTPSGPNWKDPRDPLTWTGGGHPAGDKLHGQGVVRDMLATQTPINRPQPSIPKPGSRPKGDKDDDQDDDDDKPRGGGRSGYQWGRGGGRGVLGGGLKGALGGGARTGSTGGYRWGRGGY